MTLNHFRAEITRLAEAGNTLTSIASRYDVTSAGISLALKRWGVKVLPQKGRVGRPIGKATYSFTKPLFLASLPVLPSGFIRAPSKLQLMGKGYGR